MKNEEELGIWERELRAWDDDLHRREDELKEAQDNIDLRQQELTMGQEKLERYTREVGEAVSEMHGELKLNKMAWEQGYRDAYAWRPFRGYPEGLDHLSYDSGRVEGEADRLTGKPSRVPGALRNRGEELGR